MGIEEVQHIVGRVQLALIPETDAVCPTQKAATRAAKLHVRDKLTLAVCAKLQTKSLKCSRFLIIFTLS